MKNNIWLDGLRSVARVGETAVIAARAGIKYATEKPSNAKLMRETFESLGSTYIKLGQFIASTPSLFPREYVEEFQGCLDQTPSLPFSYVQGVLDKEFAGRDLSEIFASIEEKPLNILSMPDTILSLVFVRPSLSLLKSPILTLPFFRLIQIIGNKVYRNKS